MIDDLGDIAEYYNRDPQREHNRLVRHQLERDLTWRYLERYLPAGGSILEIGAATGQYTLELARRGYALTAVDLSIGLLNECRRGLAACGLEARLAVMDARSPALAAPVQFDAVLLMGPLYHLVNENERRSALREACARLKPGGVLFSAFISRLGILGDLLKNVPEWIEDRPEVRAVMDTGRDPEHVPQEGFRGYFALAAEIPQLHESEGLETLVLAGVEPAISADDESYNILHGERRRQWLDLLEELSTQASILGASRHLLYVGRKARRSP